MDSASLLYHDKVSTTKMIIIPCHTGSAANNEIVNTIGSSSSSSRDCSYDCCSSCSTTTKPQDCTPATCEQNDSNSKQEVSTTITADDENDFPVSSVPVVVTKQRQEEDDQNNYSMRPTSSPASPLSTNQDHSIANSRLDSKNQYETPLLCASKRPSSAAGVDDGGNQVITSPTALALEQPNRRPAPLLVRSLPIPWQMAASGAAKAALALPRLRLRRNRSHGSSTGPWSAIRPSGNYSFMKKFNRNHYYSENINSMNNSTISSTTTMQQRRNKTRPKRGRDDYNYWRQRRRQRWLIPAQHPLKIVWDVLTVIWSLLHTYITHKSIQDRQFNTHQYFIRFCEIWCICDILLNFVTEYKSSNGHVLKDTRRVWARYLTTWFVVDALSLVPAETLYVQPLIERQNRRGFFLKSFYRTKAVVRVTRVLRGHHFRWFQHVARHTKHAGMGAYQLLRVLIKYVPKYVMFVRNMKAMVAVRMLRQLRWFQRIWYNVIHHQQHRRRPQLHNRHDARFDQRDNKIRKDNSFWYQYWFRKKNTMHYVENDDDDHADNDDETDPMTDGYDDDNYEDDDDFFHNGDEPDDGDTEKNYQPHSTHGSFDIGLGDHDHDDDEEDDEDGVDYHDYDMSIVRNLYRETKEWDKSVVPGAITRQRQLQRQHREQLQSHHHRNSIDHDEDDDDEGYPY